MSSTYTDNLGLRKPALRDPETYNAWDVVVNENLDAIDVVFGNRNYTEQNYITNADNHTQSLDKLDMSFADVAALAPTPDQSAALVGEGTPNVGNKYVTKSYVRVARKEILFPEFESATFKNDGTGNIGILSTDSETHGNYIYNYYKWLNSTVGSLQSYDISVQWRVPETFVSWHLTKALSVDICTEDVITTSKVVVILSKDGVVGTSSSADSVSAVPGDWSSEREGNSAIIFGVTSPVDPVIIGLVAGDTLNITIRMYSWNKYVKIGAITIQYIG